MRVGRASRRRWNMGSDGVDAFQVSSATPSDTDRVAGGSAGIERVLDRITRISFSGRLTLRVVDMLRGRRSLRRRRSSNTES